MVSLGSWMPRILDLTSRLPSEQTTSLCLALLWISNRPPSAPILIFTQENSQMYQVPCLHAAVSVSGSNQIINSIIMSFPRQSQLLLGGDCLCFETFSHEKPHSFFGTSVFFCHNIDEQHYEMSSKHRRNKCSILVVPSTAEWPELCQMFFIK